MDYYKKDLVTYISGTCNVSQTVAEKMISETFSHMGNVLKTPDNKITIPGFGTFKSIMKKERMGRNPHTGEKMLIPARRSINFKVSAKLKDNSENDEE